MDKPTSLNKKSPNEVITKIVSSHKEAVKSFIDGYFQACAMIGKSNLAKKELTPTFIRHEKQMDEAIKMILELEKQMKSAIEMTEIHQKNETRIAAIRNEIKNEDSIIISMVETLQNSKQKLEQIIVDGHKQLDLYKQSKKRKNYDTQDIINYANRIRKLTAAPSNYNPMANVTHVHAEPPYPDEVKIRNSLLMQFTENKELREGIKNEEIQPEENNDSVANQFFDANNSDNLGDPNHSDGVSGADFFEFTL